MEQEKKKHTAVYLPPDLIRRIALYQIDRTGSAHGRNQLIIDAVEQYLSRREKKQQQQ